MAEKEDVRKLSLDEMRARLHDTREELRNLRFQQATGELTDYTRVRHTRRMIARLMTIIHEEEHKGMKGDQA
jgi:large subunit ribosomal protein L29